MRRALTLLATAAFALSVAGAASAALTPPFHMDGKVCKDSQNKFAHKEDRAPPAAAGKLPVCKPGKSKPCGKTCIAMDKECHIK